MANLSAGYLFHKSDDFKEFKGALTENFVLGELMSLYETELFYWRSGNTAEVDFVFSHNMDIIPIEVKSERNSKAKSLAEYRKKYSPRVSVIASMNNVSGEDIKRVPLYLLWQLDKYLS